MSFKVYRAVIAATALMSASVQASTWTGGAGNWSSNTATGWNGTGVPNAVDAVANVAAASGTITVNGPYTIGTLTAGGTFDGKTLGTSSGNLTLDVTSGNALIDLVNGATSGAGTLGNLTFSTAVTLNDTTEVRGLVSNSSSTANFNGVIGGTGGLLLTNVATTPLNGGFRVALNTTNSFQGGINVGNGISLRLNASGAAGTGTITLANAAAASLSSIEFRTDTGNTTQVYANNIDFGTRVSGGNTILSLANSTMNVTLNGILSNNLAFGRASLNGGTLVLGGANPNTWTGQFRSDTHGTVIADKVGAINVGFDMRSQVADSMTTLLVGVTDTITGTIATGGNNAGVAFAYTGKLGLKDGNNGTVTLNSATAIDLSNALGTGGGTNVSPTPNAVSLVLHSGNGSGSLVVTTQIKDGGAAGTNPRGIQITGTGTVNLNRSSGNTYNGFTTITSGTLLFNNTTLSATGAGGVSLGAAKLGGAGFITGNLTTAGTTSILTPGNPASPTATLTLGAVNASAGADFQMQLGPTSGGGVSDLIDLKLNVLTGSTSASGLVFELSGSGIGAFGPQVGVTYDLVKFGSSSGLGYTDFSAVVQSGLVLDTAFGGGGNGFNITGTSVQVKFSAVPEPASLSTVLLSGLAVLKRRRRMA